MTPLALAYRLIASVRPSPARAWSRVAVPHQVSRRRVRRMSEVWGACVHQTGRGVVARAEREGTTPLSEALEIYDRTAGPHYLVDRDGTVLQLQADDLRGAHAGIGQRERRRYLSGDWLSDMAASGRMSTVDAWRGRWSGRRSPQHLYPTRSPNSCYVGIELLPLAMSDVGDDGLWFTGRQHDALALLLADLGSRYGWPAAWYRTPRLVGHEDIDAYERWDRRGGWDPGALLRRGPALDWPRVLGQLKQMVG